MNSTITLQEAKERITIADLWREFGFSGSPKKQCRCPFHEDKSPSFSVYDDGKKWRCFSGCGSGSIIDFLVLAKGISEEEACREILERVGGKNGYTPRIQKPKPKPAKEANKVELPPVRPYSKEIAQRITDIRGLKIIAVEFAAIWLKTVLLAEVHGQPSWILTDASRRCSEGRRIDRKPFPAMGTLGERKAHTLTGSDKSWPVGILPGGFEEPWLRRYVHDFLFVEGGPDYLAACQLIAAQNENVLPVAMLGASLDIAKNALKYFTCRNVTIVAHPDESGRGAAVKWGTQIQNAGGFVRAIQLKKGDLCDLVAAGATYDDIYRD